MSQNVNIKTYIRDGVPEIDVDEVLKHIKNLRLIDVRRPEEFNNELGHIGGAQLITLGPDLEEFIETVKNRGETIIFVCRSGNRSGTATLMAREYGLSQTFNMTGGMIRWNDFGYPVARDQ